MSVPSIAPSGANLPSPRRLKQGAAQLRSHQPSIGHMEALNILVRPLGFHSYKSYLRSWNQKPDLKQGYAIVLTARWLDSSTKQRGTLSARAELSEPWANFLPLHLRRCVYPLNHFRVLRGDRSRMTKLDAYGSWLSCVHNLGRAIQQLVFIDVMRVLPCTYKKGVQAFLGDPHRILSSTQPYMNHESLWFDPASEMAFLLNEPYGPNIEEQRQRLAAQGMLIHTAEDWNIYPGAHSQLIAPMRDEDAFFSLIERSKAMPNRLQQISFFDEDGKKIRI